MVFVWIVNRRTIFTVQRYGISESQTCMSNFFICQYPIICLSIFSKNSHFLSICRNAPFYMEISNKNTPFLQSGKSEIKKYFVKTFTFFNCKKGAMEKML